MAISPTIPFSAPPNPGEDYALLRQQGAALVEQLSGQVWTEYNESDPGITTLEQLCYALTGLSYRASFPVADLLSDPQGRIDLPHHGLHMPGRIFPSAPVTANDFRRLILDRVEAVRNVWFTPYRPTDQPNSPNGLYDVTLLLPEADPCNCDAQLQPAAIERKVRRAWCRARALCEDLHAISVLKPLPVTVAADLTLDRGETVENVLARLLFQIGLLLAPEPKRQPLEALLAAGQSPECIFNGPWVKNGFIADDQLTALVREIPVYAVVRALAQTQGAAAPQHVTVTMHGRTWAPGESIPVPQDRYLRLDTSTAPDGFPIRLFRNGAECRPDPKAVQYELNKLWTAQRRRYPLTPEYRELLPTPAGVRVDLNHYTSIQTQYPMVYGIGSYGLPPDATPLRQAQARQFKGYLMVFDQLLADFVEQIVHLKDLFSLDRGSDAAWWCHNLASLVPDVDALLAPDYLTGLQALTAEQANANDLRSRILELLLALYAETLTHASIPCCEDENSPAARQRLRGARRALLRLVVPVTRDRGRGFDYLGQPRPRNQAGLLLKSRIELNMSSLSAQPLEETLREHRIRIVSTDADATLGQPLTRQESEIEKSFTPVDISGEAHGKNHFDSAVSPLDQQSVTEDFFEAATQSHRFYAGTFAGDRQTTLVLRVNAMRPWRLVGRYADAASAAQAAKALRQVSRRIARAFTQLYVVEHILLRPRAPQPTAAAPDLSQPFDYSFTVTAVVLGDARDRRQPAFRDAVRKVLRQNTPSHVVLDLCFLDMPAMLVFEPLYWAWLAALRQNDPARIDAASAPLETFLIRTRQEPT